MKPILFAVFSVLLLQVAVAAEAPYRAEDLEAMREPNAQLVRTALSQARSAMANRRTPEGEEAIYYSPGVGSLDDWYSLPGDLFEEPARTGSFHRFTYRGGRLVSIHRHDENGEHLQSFVCYDQRGFPHVAVIQDSKGRPLRVSVLTFDQQDRIKRVLVLDGKNRAVQMHCFVHHNGYEETESRIFEASRAWAAARRTLQRANEVLVFEDGEWRKNPSYSRLAYSQALVAFGIEPVYPGALPAKPLPPRSLPRFRKRNDAADKMAR
jgi:hypothetical protein